VEQNNPKAGLYLLCPEGQNKGQMQGRWKGIVRTQILGDFFYVAYLKRQKKNSVNNNVEAS
jgi:hypothetical protein